jgi:DNA replication and repair protein RecF
MSGATLRLTELHASDLRCHADVTWNCEAGLNLLSGENGSGKTTLLEATFLMGHGRSFRQARDPFLVRHGSNGFAIRGTWMRYGPVHVAVAGDASGIMVSLQGRKLQRRSDLTENLPVLVESPQSARLMDGIPAERRRWLDQMMLYCRPDVLRHYQAYLRCMMQRGRLLRRQASSGEIEVWEQQMVSHGKIMMQAREDLLQGLNRELADEDSLNENRLTLHLPGSAPQSTGDWMQKLCEQRRQGQQILRFGPHCDRLQMHFGKRDIRAVGSRGQQKLAGVALRLAECRLRMQYRGLLPVLLLDDCFEALDPYRRDRLVERLLAHSGQVLVTGPRGANSELDNRMHCTVLPSIRKAQTRGQVPKARGMEEAA